MHYVDLSNYNYQLPFQLKEVLCIGWLDRRHQFKENFTDGGYIDKLVDIVCGTSMFNAVVNKIRGFHPCNICGHREQKFLCNNQAKWITLGNSEIWIPSAKENVYYASPSMIIHYIQDHLYSPPKEFLDAVSSVDINVKFNGQDVYSELLKEYMKN